MNILVANIPLPFNRFLVDLNEALADLHTVTHDHDKFWEMEGEYDIVHLHFPEYLNFTTQDAIQSGLTEHLISEIEKRLKYWSSHSRIVVTRHVLLPHMAKHDPQWERLYAKVYEYASGVAHFASPSIDEFESRYHDLSFRCGTPLHCVIPHQNYGSLQNSTTRAEAREKLGIPQDAKVMLVFGHIRNEEEQELILDTFHAINDSKKLLLCSRWREQLRDIAWIRLKYWVRDLTRLWYRIHPRYHFNYGFVEEADTQYYLNAADVLFIPRLKVLNSGNITLGMTFGRVVVGPDWLDVGHLLKSTNNIVFDPDHPTSAAQAMADGFALAEEGAVGVANRNTALQEWSPRQCAEMYSAFYTKVSHASVV